MNKDEFIQMNKYEFIPFTSSYWDDEDEIDEHQIYIERKAWEAEQAERRRRTTVTCPRCGRTKKRARSTWLENHQKSVCKGKKTNR